MSTTTTTDWKYLERKSGSAYKQLFVKGTRIMARILYGMAARDDEPLSLAEIAEAFDLPEEAVAEAIAYCRADPPEIRDDWEREEAKVKARSLVDPDFFPAKSLP
jgi:uncharacterized protein (DUF433 family)